MYSSELRPYLDCLLHLLLINDSWQKKRSVRKFTHVFCLWCWKFTHLQSLKVHPCGTWKRFRFCTISGLCLFCYSVGKMGPVMRGKKSGRFSSCSSEPVLMLNVHPLWHLKAVGFNLTTLCRITLVFKGTADRDALLDIVQRNKSHHQKRAYQVNLGLMFVGGSISALNYLLYTFKI